MPWIDSLKPSPPVLKITDKKDSLIYNFEKEIRRHFAGLPCIRFTGNNVRGFNLGSIQAYFKVVPVLFQDGDPENGFCVKELQKLLTGRYYITAISRTNNESEPVPLYPVTVSAP